MDINAVKQRIGINRPIVECKFGWSVSKKIVGESINRPIVECKYT